MLDNPFGDFFSNIQSKLTLAQFEAVSSNPINCDLGEETDTEQLFTNHSFLNKL